MGLKRIQLLKIDLVVFCTVAYCEHITTYFIQVSCNMLKISLMSLYIKKTQTNKRKPQQAK